MPRGGVTGDCLRGCQPHTPRAGVTKGKEWHSQNHGSLEEPCRPVLRSPRVAPGIWCRDLSGNMALTCAECALKSQRPESQVSSAAGEILAGPRHQGESFPFLLPSGLQSLLPLKEPSRKPVGKGIQEMWFADFPAQGMG